MNRKILSLILACTMVFTAILSAAPAMAEGETIETVYPEYQNAIALLKAVNPDFSLAEKDSTTRAEFVASVARMLAAQSEIVDTAPYNDVDAEHEYAPEIAFAKGMGLISDAENFNPDNPITYTEAIKILICAMGYGEKAELTGGYPTAYLKIANDLDMLDVVNLNNNSTLSHKDSVMLIFTAVCSDIAEVTGVGSNIEYSSTDGKNILSVYHKIYMAEGVVTANEFTGLKNASNTASESSIAIAKTNYYGEGYDELLGRKAKIFYRNDNKNSIVYAYAFENKEYEYTSEDIFTLSGLTLTVLPENELKEVRHRLSGEYSVIYNGKFLASADYAADLSSIEAGTVTLIDNSVSGIDVIIIKEIEYGVIGSVNTIAEKIYDANKKNGTLDLSSADYYNVKESDGTAISLGDLKTDDSIGIIKSSDGKRVEIIRYVNVVGGVYEQYSSEGTIFLDDKEYKLSKYCIDNITGIDRIKFGTDIMAFLGIGNEIINIIEFDSIINYGYVIEVGTLDAGSMNEKPAVKMLCSNGKIEALSIASNVNLDGVSSNESSVFARLTQLSNYMYDTSNLTNNSAFGYLWRVVKYSVNSKNELTSIWTTEEDKVTKLSSGASSDPDQLKAEYQAQLSKVYDSEITADSRPKLLDDNTSHTSTDGLAYYDDNMLYPFYRASSDVVVFMVPEPTALSEDWKADKHYSATNMSGLESWIDAKGVNAKCFGYDVDKTGAHLIVCGGGSGSGAVSDTSTSRIIESVTTGLNPEGEKVTVLKMFYNNTWKKYYAAPKEQITDNVTLQALYGTSEQMVKPGDIVGIALNNDNEIVAITREFMYLDGKCLDASFSNLKTNNDLGIDVTKYSRSKKDYVSGYIYALDGKRAMLACVSESDWTNGNYGVLQMRPANLASGTVVYVKFDRNKKNAIVYNEPDSSTIESYYTSGMSADYVVIRSRFEEIQLTVIYKED